MQKRIFVAGATGAIGCRLCPLLLEEGWDVIGTTRHPEKADGLRAVGVEPVIVDVFDEKRLHAVVAKSQPEIVIHQLTDLPYGLDPAKMAEGRVRNAHIRDVGTRNLISASLAAGVSRMVVQSIAFAYASGPTPYQEDSPLGISAISAFEQHVASAPFIGIILRYGKIYGPGTGFERPPDEVSVHVDAAADAARKAVTQGNAGIYNIAEDGGTVLTEKARRELHWDPAFRVSAG